MARVYHCRRIPDGVEAVYVGRPSKFGNPFVMKNEAEREIVVQRYEQWLRAERPDLIEAAKKELRGRNLSCWCSPRHCHADVLLRIANQGLIQTKLPFKRKLEEHK